MIKSLTVRNFKRFTEQVFHLRDSVVLAGPNNAGKTTLLQAVAAWRMGLDQWASHRGGRTKRTGANISRLAFTAVPLREMNLLWQERKVSGPAGPGPSRLIEIIAEGETDGTKWECGLEFQYANPEAIYVRPLNASEMEVDAIQDFPPKYAMELDVAMIPSMSGIASNEPRHERGMQDLLIGEGRAGDILRNLLLEVSGKKKDWEDLAGHIKELFGIELLPPQYSVAQPYIICEYREPPGRRPLDLSNTGSGTLQTLLLLAFLYARPASIMLIDEPDAHQHILLQSQVYRLIRKVAGQRSVQAIIATHSEVVLNHTDSSHVIAFLGDNPRSLTTQTERDGLREALKKVTTIDILLANETKAILYVEGQTDTFILHEWARILEHPAQEFLSRPFVHPLGGRHIRTARNHFFAMQAVYPEMQGLCLLDGDNRSRQDTESAKAGLKIVRWKRYEIENYLLIPAAIKRFVSLPFQSPTLMESIIDAEFEKQVPSGTDLFSDHPALSRVKASTEFLKPCLDKAIGPTSKRDLYLLAGVMEPEEIHPEVVGVLDQIYKLVRG